MLLAPDKFKGSLTAAQVSAALADGLLAAVPDATVVTVPVADGGDGTVAAVVERGWEPVEATVPGPWSDPLQATWALAPDGRTGLIELAVASGIALPAQTVPSRPADGPTRALTASTRGVGVLISAALDRGCRRIVLGVGGSATSDGGAGMLAALGARLLGADGQPVAEGVPGLAALDQVDLSGLDPRLADVEVLLASDVDNPLLGADGAAAVFGPQKGADRHTVQCIETALKRWADRLDAALGAALRHESRTGAAACQGAGAAGGTGYAALAALGAAQVSGVDYLLDLVGIDAALVGADLVVTGEGLLDRQTLSGKAPMGVLERARARGLPVVAVAGHSELAPEVARGAGFLAVHALTDLEPEVERCIADPVPLLRETGRGLATYLR